MLACRGKTNIYRSPRFARSSRELERSRVPRRPSDAEDQFLHGEVAGIERTLARFTSERDDDGRTQAKPIR